MMRQQYHKEIRLIKQIIASRNVNFFYMIIVLKESFGNNGNRSKNHFFPDRIQNITFLAKVEFKIDEKN